MRIIRMLVAALTLGICVLGYGASQYFYTQGPDRAVAYATSVDRPAIALGATTLLLVMVVLAVWPSHRKDAEKRIP